jgi:hypothetical protein
MVIELLQKSLGESKTSFFEYRNVSSTSGTEYRNAKKSNFADRLVDFLGNSNV